ncbi:MAG TPA: ABC transporter permease [Candidatus Limnocylindria bacterium]|nr:ABC transporter permease [Candidatus Limnocylindria bacterium]
MTAYIVRRLLWMVFVLLGVAAITFVVAFMVPGDPARLYAGTNASPAAIRSIHHQLGLDRPLIVQFVDYIWRVLPPIPIIKPHGLDFGYSYRYAADRHRQPGSRHLLHVPGSARPLLVDLFASHCGTAKGVSPNAVLAIKVSLPLAGRAGRGSRAT